MKKDPFVHTKDSKRKDNKKKVEIDTRYIVFFDEKYKQYELNLIEKRLEKAKSIINNPSKFDKVSSTDGKQYIKKIVYDENGEIEKNKSLFQLNDELIEKDKKFAGFGAIVTDMFDESVEKLIEISKNRWEIEDCFRQMKTGIQTRPICVRKLEHINDHFLTCFTALTLMKLLENVYAPEYTSDELFNS